MASSSTSLSDDSDLGLALHSHYGSWYEQPGRLKSAILAMETILSSLGSGQQLASYHKMFSFLPLASEFFPSLIHWIIRSGPSEILEHFICHSNDQNFHSLFFQLMIPYTPSVPGVHVPLMSSNSFTLQYSSLDLLSFIGFGLIRKTNDFLFEFIP
jgi:hypothetical protein